MQYIVSFLLFIELLTSSCSNWNLESFKRNTNLIKTISLNFPDPDGFFSRSIRNQLQINGIEVIEKDFLLNKIPLLDLLSLTMTQDAVSFFQDGQVAEYQTVISAKFNLFIPDNNIYPISIKVRYTSVDVSQTPLEKFTNKKLIINEMYEKLSKELVRKLLIIQIQNEIKNNKKISKTKFNFQKSIK